MLFLQVKHEFSSSRGGGGGGILILSGPPIWTKPKANVMFVSDCVDNTKKREGDNIRGMWNYPKSIATKGGKEGRNLNSVI